ncbi:hypothetical protein GH5_02255 [Leishmania sp. Ghana 2012 LV757]|uniref:hypothetical protein n=1 Tax=Leishmania sp. Ghana 2012 LV757 TaxID=2803181 RepID=UPI001B41BE9A|nr:hypothetical protein GH5_02255 [Leishmania sp. Ghana 2012 LV757]
MELQLPIPATVSGQQSTVARALSTSLKHWSSHSDEETPTCSCPVTPECGRQGQQDSIVKAAATPKGDDDGEKRCAAAFMDTTSAEEYDADDAVSCNVMRSGCGEAILPPLRGTESSVVGLSLGVTAKPLVVSSVLPAQPTVAAAPVGVDGSDWHAVSAARAATLISSPPQQVSIHGTCNATQHTPEAPGDRSSFASKAIQAIALQASTAGPPLRLNCSRSDLSSLVGGASGNDPMGVRQLYSLPGSGVGSLLGIPTLAQRGAAQPLAAADAFSMERFAAFFEVALEELMDECERRVANAPAAWRDSQRQLIGGGLNRNLTTSTHSFDSPRSSAVSRLDGAPSSVALSCNTPVYPPCFTNPLHNMHGLHYRELSGDDVAGQHRTVGSPQPPPPLSLNSRAPFVSAAVQARQAGEEKSIAAEGAVSTLLASLGRHHGNMAPMVFIAGLAYLARVTEQCTSEFLSVTRANWYRLTTTSILVAAKVYDDHSSSRLNACFARSSGIPLGEMSWLELDFLYLLDFDLLLKESEVEQWLIWMETLALRHDLMKPLNTYVLGPSASTTAARLNSTPKPSLANGLTFAEYRDGNKTGSMCEASHTPGLSSEVFGGEEETNESSPSSVAGPRSFSRMQVVSNSVGTAHGACSSTANWRCPPGAAATADMPSLTAPLTDLSSVPPRSSVSSVMPPAAPLDGTCSALSAVSLPGGAPSPLTCRRGFAPPLPIHGALLCRPPTATTRLFSVVHGTADPPSPILVRQLCRVGGSPPSPLRPPSVERHSPVRFFKSQGMRAHGPDRHFSAAVGFTALGPYGAEDDGRKVSKQSSHGTVTKAGSAILVGRTSVTAAAETRCNAAAERHRQSKRWAPFGMVQHVRDVLGVTASLVRGRLNVLAPSAHAEEVGRPPPLLRRSSGAYSSLMRLMNERKPQADGARFASSVMSCPTGSPCEPVPAVSARHRSGCATSGAMAWQSTVPQSNLQCADVRSSAEADGDYSDDEEDEECEACEYGYYDEDGYFHYYDDEDAEGEYDDQEEEEEAEDEAAYFQRCHPPLTHSPPSL